MDISPQIKAVLHNSNIQVENILPIFIAKPDLLELSHTGTITSDILIQLYHKVATDSDSKPGVFSIETETGKHSFTISYPYSKKSGDIERHLKLIKPAGAPKGNTTARKYDAVR